MDNQPTPSLKDSISEAFKTDTPPKDFFDLRKTSLPPTYENAKVRVETNLLRFKSYYLSVCLFFLFIFFLLRPSFGFFLGIASLSYYLHQSLPTIKGYKTTPLMVNIGTGVSFFICALILNHTLVSILALLSLISLTILSHAVTFEKVETEEEGV